MEGRKGCALATSGWAPTLEKLGASPEPTPPATRGLAGDHQGRADRGTSMRRKPGLARPWGASEAKGQGGPVCPQWGVWACPREAGLKQGCGGSRPCPTAGPNPAGLTPAAVPAPEPEPSPDFVICNLSLALLCICHLKTSEPLASVAQGLSVDL